MGISQVQTDSRGNSRDNITILGLHSLSGKTSYRQISRSLKAAWLDVYNDGIALKFDRHIGSVAVQVPFKFRDNWKSLNANLAASRFHKISR